MRALTICQPYAHLIVMGEKRVENRTWPTRYRGPLAIHAGKSLAWMDGERPSADMAFGAIVGVVDLIDCVALDVAESMAMACKKYPWFVGHEHVEGPFCFVLDNVRRFDLPMPWKGAQGFWYVPDYAVAEFA